MNTQLGGNFTINNKPQYNVFTDLPPDIGVANILTNEEAMSRYYSEAINANQYRIHVRAGVAEYNSMTSFLSGMVDPDAESVVRTGQTKGVMYTLGRIAGFVLSIPLLPLVGISKLWRFLTDKPSNKYMYLKPTMNVFWNTVNIIANTIAVKMKLTAEAVYGESNDGQYETTLANGDVVKTGFIDPNASLGAAAVTEFNRLAPGIFNLGSGEVNGIDVYALATRAARADIKMRRKLNAELAGASTAEDYTDRIIDMVKNGHTSSMVTGVATSTADDAIANIIDGEGTGARSGYRSIEEYNKTYGESTMTQIDESYLSDSVNNSDGSINQGGNVNFTDAQLAAGDYGNLGVNTNGSPTGGWASQDVLDMVQAELEEGAGWVTFGVDGSNTAEWTVSNTAKSSDLLDGLNGISSTARSANHSLFNGNLGDGAIAGTIESVVGGMADFASGALDSLGLSGAAMLRGRVYTDMAESWDNSTVSCPMKTYEIDLDPGVGNKMALLTQQIIPLAMLMAISFPRKTGGSTYGSPFLLELYDKGLSQSKLCMVESVKFVRGEGHVPYQVDGMCTNIKVSITFKDLSGMLTIPVNSGYSMKEMLGLSILDDEDAFSEQMNCLAALGIHEQLMKSERIKRRAQLINTQWHQWFSPSHMINYAGSTLPARAVGMFFRSTAL